jgi:hypothetical protein
MANICNNEKLINDNDDYMDQFITILKKISKLQINVLLYGDYYDSLKKISKDNKNKNIILKHLCLYLNLKLLKILNIISIHIYYTISLLIFNEKLLNH